MKRPSAAMQQLIYGIFIRIFIASQPMNLLPKPVYSPAMAGHLWAVLVISSGSLLLSPARAFLDLSNVALLYVLAVVIIAVRFGRSPAIAAALFGSLSFAYVFVPPHFSLAITETQYLLSAVIMLVVAILVGHLTSRLKQHADFASRKTGESAELYGFAQALAGALTRDEVIQSASRFLEASVQAQDIRVITPSEMDQELDPLTKPALVRQCAEKKMFISSPTRDGHSYAYVLLNAASGTQGVLRFKTALAGVSSDAAVEYIETAASVLAVALERSHFAEIARATEIKHAAESLRSSVLSALSHDLRTPLTALVGMVDTVVLGKVSPERQKTLLEAIRNQALSISRQMTNLLEMARLSAGKLELKTAWQPVDEVLGATLQQVRAQWKDREITVDVSAELPPINIDAVLIERVLWNLIENAIKYAPADTPIEIAARQLAGDVELSICDSGPGIPAEAIDKIFDLFQRGRVESDVPGIGLGLSIAKTIVEAHGGNITARNRFGGGSCFRIRLPVGTPPDFDEMELPV